MTHDALGIRPSHRPSGAWLRWFTACSLAALLVLAGSTLGWAQADEGDEAPAGPATVDLTPKFEPGKETRYEIWTRTERTFSVSVNGRQPPAQSMVIEISGQYLWRVQQVHSDGSATCKLTFDYLTAAITAPNGETQQMDSRNMADPNNPLAGLLDAIGGATLSYEVAADGVVESVSGVQAIRDQVSGVEAPDERDFRETASTLAVIPGAPAEAEAGQSWQMQHEWGRQLGLLSMDMTRRLEGVEQISGIPVATVSTQASLSFEPDLSKLPSGPNAPQVNIRMNQGSYSGQVMFDLQRGEVVGRNSVETRTTKISMQVRQMNREQTIEERVQSQVLRIAEP